MEKSIIVPTFSCSNFFPAQAKDTTSTGGGISQGVGKFLQCGGSGDPVVWVGNMGPFGFNGKKDRWDKHRIHENDHGEESEVIRI